MKKKKKKKKKIIIEDYHNVHKFSDSQIWVNSVDQDLPFRLFGRFTLQ